MYISHVDIGPCLDMPNQRADMYVFTKNRGNKYLIFLKKIVYDQHHKNKNFCKIWTMATIKMRIFAKNL